MKDSERYALTVGLLAMPYYRAPRHRGRPAKQAVQPQRVRFTKDGKFKVTDATAALLKELRAQFCAAHEIYIPFFMDACRAFVATDLSETAATHPLLEAKDMGELALLQECFTFALRCYDRILVMSESAAVCALVVLVRTYVGLYKDHPRLFHFGPYWAVEFTTCVAATQMDDLFPPHRSAFVECLAQTPPEGSGDDPALVAFYTLMGDIAFL